MATLSRVTRSIIHLLVVWFIDTLALLFTAWIMPGVKFIPNAEAGTFVLATITALVLSIMNFLIRPILLLLTVPLGWMATFLAGFFINALVLWLTAQLMPGFEVSSLFTAFIASLILSLANTILITLLNIDDDDSFYENLVQRRAARQAGQVTPSEGRGLVLLEVDGLSYQRMKGAIESGLMPTLKQMMDEEGYQLSRVEVGIPPTTPACQAGILQGNNTNIPAFRWLDKKTGRLLAGGGAAAEVEPLISDGNGLLRGGTSIGNMFSGDAAKSILTFSKIKEGTPEDKKQRTRDMFWLMRDPYFLTRTLVLYFGDVFLEIWQGWQQRRKNVTPRLNRLHNGYPLLRAGINVFLRDIGTYFTILDIIRGAPAIYTLYAGYDEVAHHAGVHTRDADLTLTQFDRQVARLKRVIETKASRPYEILILSDHGQSWGPTFKQRYGISILEFIQQQMPQGVTVSGSGGGDDGTMGVAAMMDELQNMEDSGQGGTVSNSAMRGAQRLVKNNLDNMEAFQEYKPSKVTLAYGGNGALVYFDLFDRRITLNELNAAYPGMVDALVKHEGIGFVIAYEDDLEPVVFGKDGARNLHTGDIIGEDPLLPFGDVELRAWQLRRLADFENSGDLILNSTLYPDGTVAALEELIGNHGGLGGEQTDAYLFHPGDMLVPPTRSAYEFKAILDSRRGLPGTAPKPERPVAPLIDPWKPANIAKGLGMLGTWLGLAARAVMLSKDAFREIAANPYMSAPGLLIAILGQIIAYTLSQNESSFWTEAVGIAGWFVAVIFLQVSARLLRGKANFQATFRVAAFAQAAHFINLFAFIPVIGPLARPLSYVLVVMAMWVGMATAHELRGWRSLLIPVIYILVIVVTFFFLLVAAKGIGLSLQAILGWFGLTAQP
jgi:uncharacterized membrane protein YvlD (DUF360 family)